MNDNKDQTELSALLDGEADQPEVLRQRLAADPESARRYASYQAMGEALRALPAPQAADDFTERVLAATRQVSPDTAPKLPRWAAAACLVLLAAVGFYSYPRDQAPAATAKVPVLTPEMITWTEDDPLWEDEAWPEMDTMQLARVTVGLSPESEEDTTDTSLFDVMDMMDSVDEAVLQDLLRAWSQEG